MLINFNLLLKYHQIIVTDQARPACSMCWLEGLIYYKVNTYKYMYSFIYNLLTQQRTSTYLILQYNCPMIAT
jgi:hypothetical protein